MVLLRLRVVGALDLLRGGHRRHAEQSIVIESIELLVELGDLSLLRLGEHLLRRWRRSPRRRRTRPAHVLTMAAQFSAISCGVHTEPAPSLNLPAASTTLNAYILA